MIYLNDAPADLLEGRIAQKVARQGARLGAAASPL